ncbi:hypothetical protein G6011_06097 [Alternaria panax]|uniref:Uncharacterized protein n=1 Tax=Alternaria panax TaxID=48097 RepID=A0AAD4FKU1_9PLEO|nr:hypothetical protein G6011_06097 [Alternaria panax]
MKPLATNHQETIDLLQTGHLRNTNATSEFVGHQPRPLSDLEKEVETMEVKPSAGEVASTAGDVEAIRNKMKELGSRIDVLEVKTDKNRELRHRIGPVGIFNHTPAKREMGH